MSECGSLFHAQVKISLFWINNPRTPQSSCSFCSTHYLESFLNCLIGQRNVGGEKAGNGQLELFGKAFLAEDADTFTTNL